MSLKGLSLKRCVSKGVPLKVWFVARHASVLRTYSISKRDLFHIKKRPILYQKETYSLSKRDLFFIKKRPILYQKESCQHARSCFLFSTWLASAMKCEWQGWVCGLMVVFGVGVV